MNTAHFELSDCWSSEHQPATYYRIAAAQARRLQADATTPSIKQYLDRMIAHCERLAGTAEPGASPGPNSRSAGITRLTRNHDRPSTEGLQTFPWSTDFIV